MHLSELAVRCVFLAIGVALVTLTSYAVAGIIVVLLAVFPYSKECGDDDGPMHAD